MVSKYGKIIIGVITKSTDLIGDIVIEEVLGTAQIIDDYIDVCEKWVKCYWTIVKPVDTFS